MSALSIFILWFVIKTALQTLILGNEPTFTWQAKPRGYNKKKQTLLHAFPVFLWLMCVSSIQNQRSAVNPHY